MLPARPAVGLHGLIWVEKQLWAAGDSNPDLRIKSPRHRHSCSRPIVPPGNFEIPTRELKARCSASELRRFKYRIYFIYFTGPSIAGATKGPADSLAEERRKPNRIPPLCAAEPLTGIEPMAC